jgi:ribA/ribD-fused uncharacterized protein
MIDSFRGEYAFLSNFYPSPIVEDHEITYPTVEHYFQAQKAENREARKRIAAAPTPDKAKYAGLRVQLRPDWEVRKLNVMRNALEMKFEAGSQLAGALQSTYPHRLEEGNNWGDTYWGRVNGGGWNWLGHLLMARRAELIGT